MKPRITVITLGVNDIEKPVAFYRDGLGLKTEGIGAKQSRTSHEALDSFVATLLAMTALLCPHVFGATFCQ